MVGLQLGRSGRSQLDPIRFHPDKKDFHTEENKKEKRHTQLGAVVDGPSHPMWATCFTSVGNPICISGSLQLGSATILNEFFFFSK